MIARSVSSSGTAHPEQRPSLSRTHLSFAGWLLAMSGRTEGILQ